MNKTIYLNTNLIFLRHSIKFSQMEFGWLFDLSRGQVRSYETGLHEPKIKTLIKISHHFKISINDLLLINLNTQTNEKSSIRSVAQG